jgi:hypothetical protein
MRARLAGARSGRRATSQPAGAMWNRARLDLDGWRCPAGPAVKTRGRFTVAARTTRTVRAERRLPAQTARSWHTQEVVPLSNTPAALRAV